MRQLVQSVRDGRLRIIDGPDPIVGPTEVLVQTSRSTVSAGTERSARQLASASLLAKARARPDLVRQVLRRARQDGFRSTLAAVQSRLDDEMPLGYSASGIVLEVGEAVRSVRPGMRVATAGAGHGDVQVVAALLTVPVPDGVTDEQAAFATIGSVGLHAMRLGDLGPGATVAVVGLGLIGQLTMRLARSSGLRVVGVDLRDWAVGIARAAGHDAMVERGEVTTLAVENWSRSRGCDAVIITAATPSSQPVRLAASRVRDRGTIVVVGDIGMDLEREPLYERELNVRVARSFGPGRYDRSYEDWAVDYPSGHVQFTVARNLETVLDLLDTGTLNVDDLVTHRFDFDRAEAAYRLLDDPTARYLGIQLTYGERKVTATAPPFVVPSTVNRIALIGAGAFARGVLVPSIEASRLGTVTCVSSATGSSAVRLAEQVGAAAVEVEQALIDPQVDCVMIATSHDSHADLVVRALDAGKHVYCEKPLALTEDELEQISAAWKRAGTQLWTGFNRRHASDIESALRALGTTGGPLLVTYRVSADVVPPSHWYNDRRMGGRLIGEACHFVDACCWLVRRPVLRVEAVGGTGAELLCTTDFTVSLAFADGSVSVVSYATGGHRGTAKERIEVLGRSHTIVIDDFRSIEFDGNVARHRQDKGHVANLVAFERAIREGGNDSTLQSIQTTRLCLDAVRSLSGATTVVADISTVPK